MYFVMFVIGLVCGVILSTGITVIWYDDEDLKKLVEDKNNGNNKTL